MGILSKVEDRPTPPEVYNWRCYASAGVASFAAVMIGYDSAFIGTSLSMDSFKDEFGLTDLSDDAFRATTSNITSCYIASAFFGAIFGFLGGYYLGRRWTLQIAATCAVLGAALNTGASSATGLDLIYAGRVFIGLAVGMSTNMTPLYIAEIAPPAIRGRLIGFYELCWQLGGLNGFWINYGIKQHIPYSKKQWLIPFAVQLIPAGLFFFGLIFIRESPRWLVTKGKMEKARANLSYLRKLPEGHQYVEEEISAVQEQYEHEISIVGEGFFASMWEFKRNTVLLKRLFITTTLFLFQNGTGVNAINYYSPKIFATLGLQGQSTSLFTTGLFGVVKTTFMFVWLLLLIDHFGRRALLVTGSTFGPVAHFIIGGYICVARPTQNPTDSPPPMGIFAIFCFYVYTVAYTISWAGVPWVIGSESYPTAVRNFSQMSTACSNWFWTFWITKYTPDMFATMGHDDGDGYGVFIFFGLMMFFGGVFTYLLVPETKNIPLEAMDTLWAGGYSPRKANKQVMDMLRLQSGMNEGGVEAGAAGSDLEKPETEYVEKV